jgi:hypothetical protein
MSIICNNHIKYNIGIDIGDGLMCPILYNNIPCENVILFIVGDISFLYYINIFMGNNILSEDNTLIYKTSILSPEKIIYIKLNIDNILYHHNMVLITIYTKTLVLLNEVIVLPILDIIYVIKNIDISKYKLRFELKEIIETIKNKINTNMIKLDESDKIILNQKLDNVISNITELNNIKLLEIKNNLKNKFFL